MGGRHLCVDLIPRTGERGTALYLQSRRSALGQHPRHIPQTGSGDTEGDERPVDSERTRRHVPFRVDMQLEGRPGIRLLLIQRPDTLDAGALHRSDEGHDDRECMGAGTVLRRREEAVYDYLGFVYTGKIPRRIGGAQEQPPPLLHHDEGFQDILRDEAAHRPRLQLHRRHDGEEGQGRLRDGIEGQHAQAAQHQGGFLLDTLRPVERSIGGIHPDVLRGTVNGIRERMVVYIL